MHRSDVIPWKKACEIPGEGRILELTGGGMSNNQPWQLLSTAAHHAAASLKQLVGLKITRN